MAGRAKVPEELQALTKSELLTVIDEAALGFENTLIARRILIDHYPQADIAAEIGYDRSVVSPSQASQNALLIANNEAQTAELIRRINPMPVPSYQVPAPYPFCGSGYGCGC